MSGKITGMPYFISAAIAAAIAIMILVLTEVPDDVRRFDTGAKSGVWTNQVARIVPPST